MLRRHCTASTLIRPCPTPALAAACRDVEAATLAHDGSPPITRTTIPTCRAHYPGGSSGCACRLLPHSCSLPQMAGGSASALSLSRPAQASHMLRPTGSLSRPRRPLSRGSSPSGHPAEPPVSYQINRQFSGWILPPQVIRAFGAHCQDPTSLQRWLDHKTLAVCGLALERAAVWRHPAGAIARCRSASCHAGRLGLGKGHRVPAPLVACSASGMLFVSLTLRWCCFTREVDRDRLRCGKWGNWRSQRPVLRRSRTGSVSLPDWSSEKCRPGRDTRTAGMSLARRATCSRQNQVL